MSYMADVTLVLRPSYLKSQLEDILSRFVDVETL